MYRTIIFCDVCEKEMARGELEPYPKATETSFVATPIDGFSFGCSLAVGNIEIYDVVRLHACSKVCAKGLLSKLEIAITKSTARETSK